MAVLSDYTSGTITLANGSTAVTGTGTLFDVAKFREGDTLQVQNLTAVIASVNSNTSLTLTAPWSGTSLADAPYRARYLPDGARVTAQATTLIELLGNGVLSNLAELGVEEGKTPVGNLAGQYELKTVPTDPNGSLGKLAALTLAANKIIRTDAAGNASQGDITNAAAALLTLAGAADKLPFFNGANSAALTELTAFARSLLSAANGGDARTILTAQTNLENVSNFEFGRMLTGDRSAFIDFHAEGTPGAIDRSARVIRNSGTNGTFQITNNGSGGIILSSNDGVSIPLGSLNSTWAYNNTTVSAANVFITSSAAFARSTSSGVYKTDIENLDDEHRDLIMDLRPVWYRSLCTLDNPEWSFYGLIAEEVAEVDPRLVHWQTSETTYEEKRSFVTVEDIITDEETGEKTVEPREVEIVEQVPKEVELETPRPVGVMYDRLVPHLIAKIQELTARLDAMESGL